MITRTFFSHSRSEQFWSDDKRQDKKSLKLKISKRLGWKFLKVEARNISHISSRLVNVSWVVWPSTYHKKKCRLMNCCDERALAYLDWSFFMMHLKPRQFIKGCCHLVGCSSICGTKDLCFLHPIFLSFGFWYFGHFSCVIFFLTCPSCLAKCKQRLRNISVFL